MVGWLGKVCGPLRLHWLAAAVCMLLAVEPSAHAQSSAQLDTAAAKFETLAKAGKTDAAIALGNRLVRAARKALPRTDPRLGVYISELAQLYSDRGRLEAAAKLALEALLLPVADNNSPGPDLKALSDILAKAKKLDAAEAAIVRALALAEDGDGPGSVQARALQTRLAEIYERQGRTAEAANLRQRVASLPDDLGRPAGQTFDLPTAVPQDKRSAQEEGAGGGASSADQQQPMAAPPPPAVSEPQPGAAAPSTEAAPPPEVVEKAPPAKTTLAKPKMGARRKPAAATPAEPNFANIDQADYSVVNVFYGTNRQPGPGSARVSFTSGDANKLTLGMARVTVPASHQVPQVERPWALRVPGTEIEITFETQDPKKHFTIASIEALPQDQFLAKARDQLAQSKTFKGQAFVFVHGFYNTFDDALYRTAQIAYDMQFDGATFMYSWPSAGTLDAYRSDLPRAKAAGRHLRAFLDLVAHKTGATRISVIAHSMGNRPLMEALDETVAFDRPSPDTAIDEVVLAAPDVGREEFSTMIGHMQNVRGGITLYAASNDLALAASQTFNHEPRAGDTRYGGPLLLPHMDTIDATLTSLQLFRLNHYYVAESSSILCDLEHILRNGERPPDKRSKMFMSVKDTQGTYYAYRP